MGFRYELELFTPDEIYKFPWYSIDTIDYFLNYKIWEYRFINYDKLIKLILSDSRTCIRAYSAPYFMQVIEVRFFRNNKVYSVNFILTKKCYYKLLSNVHIIRTRSKVYFFKKIKKLNWSKYGF